MATDHNPERDAFILAFAVILLLSLGSIQLSPRPDPQKKAERIASASDRWTVTHIYDASGISGVALGRIIPNQPAGAIFGETEIVDFPRETLHKSGIEKGTILWFETLPKGTPTRFNIAGEYLKVHNLFRENPHPMHSLRL